MQSRLVRVVGEIIGLSLSASHQAAAQGGRQGSPPRQEALTQKSPKVTQSVSIVTPLLLIMVCVQPVPVVDRKVDYGIL